ncbi:MAG TPA: BON domain-containing protein [Longimicrobiaceae bacterium]|nr:BON domain-containing protein [Longimicrobiaceae bacterium]
MKTSQELQKDVREELQWEPSIAPGGIRVAVEGGVVTLSGHVQSYLQRMNAEKAVKRVKGVHGIANDLEIRLPSSHERDDTEIAEAALHALTWHTTVPENKVRVTVSRGWVTLEGEVEWYYQRDAAFRAVHSLTGVKGVVNRIEIRARLSPTDIQHRIEERFRRSAELDAKGVKVEVDGSRVTLKGSVTSLDECDEAEWAAWSAPGVERVTNELKVTPELFELV